MVQGKKQLNSKPKFAEVVIGDNEAKEMRESANARNRRNPYLKLSYPNGVTLILPADISIEQLRAYIIQMPHFNDDNRTTTLTPDEFTLLILGEKWYEETPSES